MGLLLLFKNLMFFIFKITPRAFEIMAKNIPNLKMKTDTQVHEAQRQDKTRQNQRDSYQDIL